MNPFRDMPCGMVCKQVVSSHLTMPHKENILLSLSFSPFLHHEPRPPFHTFECLPPQVTELLFSLCPCHKNSLNRLYMCCLTFSDQSHIQDSTI